MTQENNNYNNNNNDNNKLLLKNKIAEKLEEIYDPEFPMDVISLGLIREIEIDDDFNVKIIMTLTTPHCPYGPMFIEQIKAEIEFLEGVKKIEIELTFDPPWSPDMMK
ncbi:MAG: iron-sulfur cluster assembly protein [Candidatus Nanoarchaeia archaeon]|nr:iron-sulfur cluster assembly protein [Candidatus Nanoarchaeia archaeon]